MCVWIGLVFDLHFFCCSQWVYGATAARLTPDQKVGSSNLSALIYEQLIALKLLKRYVSMS